MPLSETQPRRRVHTHLKGRVGQVVIDNPPSNALDLATLEGVRAGLERLEGAVDVLVLRGEGACFSRGADAAQLGPDHAGAWLRALEVLATELIDFPAVTVAAAHGACLGPGAELLLCCDFAVAAEGAEIGFTQIDLGCFPPVGAALLPTIAGRAATELILLGTRLTAQRAKDLGIVTDVAPPNGLSDRVEALVGRLLEKSGAALRASAVALRATPEALARQVEVLQRMRRHYVSDVLVTEDSREGIDAHLEGRPPRWKHR